MDHSPTMTDIPEAQLQLKTLADCRTLATTIYLESKSRPAEIDALRLLLRLTWLESHHPLVTPERWSELQKRQGDLTQHLRQLQRLESECNQYRVQG